MVGGVEGTRILEPLGQARLLTLELAVLKTQAAAVLSDNAHGHGLRLLRVAYRILRGWAPGRFPDNMPPYMKNRN